MHGRYIHCTLSMKKINIKPNAFTFVTVTRALPAYLIRILAAAYPIGWHGIFGRRTELVPFSFSLYAVSLKIQFLFIISPHFVIHCNCLVDF